MPPDMVGAATAQVGTVHSTSPTFWGAPDVRFKMTPCTVWSDELVSRVFLRPVGAFWHTRAGPGCTRAHPGGCVGAPCRPPMMHARTHARMHAWHGGLGCAYGWWLAKNMHAHGLVGVHPSSLYFCTGLWMGCTPPTSISTLPSNSAPLWIDHSPS